MTLYVGRHMIGMHPIPDPEHVPGQPSEWEPSLRHEDSVEFEIVSLGPNFQTRGADGEFAHEECLVLLRKVK